MQKNAFSLVEMLITIAVIGILAAIALPIISKLHESSRSTKNLANAKHIQRMSAALASLGVAHVIPDSLGGVEATARLLREGVIVPEGPMAGEAFVMPGLRDEDITELSKYLRVQYDMRELRLVFVPDTSTYHYCPNSTIESLCIVTTPSQTNELAS